MIVTAVTLSDKPAVLPDAKDIPAPDSLKSDVDTLDPTQWFVVEPKRDTFQPTCIDQLVHLDGPAGKHGFQKTVNGKWVFDDGTPCRMVATMGNAPSTKAQAVFLARWLAKYGFTMVRVGHLITAPATTRSSTGTNPIPSNSTPLTWTGWTFSSMNWPRTASTPASARSGIAR